MNMQKKLALYIAAGITFSTPLIAGDFSGNIGLEGRYYLEDAAHIGQKDGGISLSLQPEYKHKWDNDHNVFTAIPFYRWDDKDKERTHGDIRQLDLIMSQGDWEFQAGISKVFWGVAESQHLVDIINQTDAVEGTDGEDKLGQPMLRASRIYDDGSLNLYVLPYFRERTFSGKGGRFRTPLVVDTDNVSYEDDDKDKHIDYALRLQHTFDQIDLGLSYFDGTSRDPELAPLFTTQSPATLQQYYSLIKQTGLDLQYTGEEWILKLEAINRNTDKDDYSAAVGGFEYTIPGITEGGADLGLLAEYHRDSRGTKATSVFQNDLFIAARFNVNDADSSEILAGALFDLDNQSQSLRIEGSKRIGEGLKVNVEAQVFTNIDETDLLKNFEKDDYMQVEFQKYF